MLRLVNTTKILAGIVALAALPAAFPVHAQGLPETLQSSQAIRDEQYTQMDRYLDGLIEQADAKRAGYWGNLDFSSPNSYDQSAEQYRRAWGAFLGVPAAGRIPATALAVRREKAADFASYVAYRVWIDTLPGVQTYGILLIPKNLTAKAAALVCLHGHGGTPEELAGFLTEQELKGSAYRVFAKTAVERGYVVWVPHIHSLYSEEHEPQEGPQAQGRDILHKKAQVVGLTVMGVEIAKLQRSIDYLQALPEVDPDRIGMYGLSKGGHYTLYTAPLDPRIKAAVVSGWFNHRTRKLMAPAEGPGMFFITHIHRFEYFLPDLLNRFGDAELGWMIAPRALLIENGTKDRAVLVGDARQEFQRVKQVYDRIGLGEKARFAAFDGIHRIDGVEAFPFLDKWLGHTPR